MMKVVDLNRMGNRASAVWLALAVPVTIVAGLIYVTVQQDFRQTANDPQIQISEDAAAALSTRRQPGEIVPGTKVDMAKSLSPFIMVLNDSGDPVASSGELGGRVPRIPARVIDYVRRHGEERVTWQPRPGVRIAAVIRRYEAASPGFVAAGRSLREVEKRVSALSQLVTLGWTAALLASAFVCLILAYLERI